MSSTTPNLTLRQIYTRKISPASIPEDDLPSLLRPSTLWEKLAELPSLVAENQDTSIVGGIAALAASRFLGRKTLAVAGLLAGATALPLSLHVYRRLVTLRAPAEVQETVAKTISYSEEDPEFTDYDKEHVKIDGPTGRRSRRWAFMPFAVRSIKADIGLVADNAANRLVVRRKFFNMAFEHGIRPHHIQEIIDLGIDAVLTPSDKDIEALQYRRTTTIISRNAEFAYWGGRKAAQ